MALEQNHSCCRQKIIIIVGPTACGKSELAVRLAEKVSGEIINADSMQFYSDMAIGTARPTDDLLSRAPHHLYGIVAPGVNFTAADFILAAREVIGEIIERGNTPLVVGGTGLYIRALLCGLAESPAADEGYRRYLATYANQNGASALHALLASVDPVSAGRLHVNDSVRIIRALEVFHQTGRPISSVQSVHGFAYELYDALKIGVHVDRELLYQRIEKRVDGMIEKGLVSEVQGLISRGFSPELKALGAIGYKEICDYLAGKSTFTDAVALIKRNTRRYAKRQLTWFRKDQEIKWLEYPETFDNINKIVCDFINRRSV